MVGGQGAEGPGLVTKPGSHDNEVASSESSEVSPRALPWPWVTQLTLEDDCSCGEGTRGAIDGLRGPRERRGWGGHRHEALVGLEVYFGGESCQDLLMDRVHS